VYIYRYVIYVYTIRIHNNRLPVTPHVAKFILCNIIFFTTRVGAENGLDFGRVEIQFFFHPPLSVRQNFQPCVGYCNMRRRRKTTSSARQEPHVLFRVNFVRIVDTINVYMTTCNNDIKNDFLLARQRIPVGIWIFSSAVSVIYYIIYYAMSNKNITPSHSRILTAMRSKNIFVFIFSHERSPLHDLLWCILHNTLQSL